MFLTKEAYFPPAYPCGLSQFEFKGPDVHLIQRLGKIPVGTTVTIESAKVKTDLYSPQMLKIKGKVLFNAKLIGYNGTFTRDEFSDWFKKID